MRGAYFRALAPSFVLLVLAAACAATVTEIAHLEPGGVASGYLAASGFITLMAVLVWIFTTTLRYKHLKLERPAIRAGKGLRVRLPLLVLPLAVFPLFWSAFTTAKTGIAFITGFTWDARLAALDRAIFLADPWRITHAFIDDAVNQAMVGLYAVWGTMLPFVTAMVALYGRSRSVAIYSFAMTATWLVGGVGAAYLFASAGPALIHAFDPALGRQFAGLVAAIKASPGGDLVLQSQDYLIALSHSRAVYPGGGISAMPSMHVAATVIFALAARGTKWFVPAVAFSLLIWVASVHLGYHYAVDGPAGALVAYGCWRGAERLQARMERPAVAAISAPPDRLRVDRRFR